MALTDILVHLDHHAGSATRLEVAVALAKRHGARLTGLLVLRHQYPPEAAVAAAQGLFQKLVEGAGIEGQWCCVDGSAMGIGMTELVISHAHCSDLVIVGQGSLHSADMGVPFDLPKRVVLGAGRPVLIVPYAGTFASVGERVLVAWKPGREAARAVYDALPLLAKAQRVDILAKISTKAAARQESPCAGLCAHLARHGIPARAQAMILADTPFGDALLNRVCDEGFDLLVVGALAHGSEGKPVLGSVARHLLRQMTVPVLMSH